jgi:solute carrier family 25 carnitine/acylcarnitine transporter 20/29
MEDFEKIEQDLNAGWVRTVKDLFAGASGGITQVLLGE